MAEHKRLPHLRAYASQPIVFVTTCAFQRRSILANEAVHAVLREVWSNFGDLHGWVVGRYVVMPDHVHFFARARREALDLPRWMRAWKSFSAREIFKSGSPAYTKSVWQRDYFDRFLRSGESYSEKWDYVRNNPVRAGLVETPDDWPFQGEIHDLRF